MREDRWIYIQTVAGTEDESVPEAVGVWVIVGRKKEGWVIKRACAGFIGWGSEKLSRDGRLIEVRKATEEVRLWDK